MPELSFKIKPYKLKLKLHSLKEKDLKLFEPLLTKAAEELDLDLETEQEILKKKNLKNYKPPDDKWDASVLVHRNSGRLLITDRNGIFDTLIHKLFAKTSKP